YYDNPQPYVNAIYSRLASDIARTGARFLYASANLEETGICRQDGASLGVDGVGIGFFPMEDVELLTDLRKQRKCILHNLPAYIRGKRLFAYVGAANSEYYTKTFPYIVDLLAQAQDRLTDCMILLQQHPRALQEGDYDGRLVDTNGHLPIMRSPL